MLVCRFSSSVFDDRELVNYVTCRNPDCGRYGALVNTHQCGKCTKQQIAEMIRYKEGPFSRLKSDEVAQKSLVDACTQCQEYNAEEKTCKRLHTSQTILEYIKHPNHVCPRGLW